MTGGAARDAMGTDIVRDFGMRSAMCGNEHAHILTLAMAERLRGITASLFSRRRTQLRVSEIFMKRLVAESSSSSGHTHLVHCDEAVAAHLHFSSVLWLNTHSRDFDGGELAFYSERLPWLLVEPAAGRAAFYASGWENIHRVKPLTRGARWALVVLFEAHSERLPLHNRTEAYLDRCVRPTSAQAWESCLQDWAVIFDESTQQATT